MVIPDKLDRLFGALFGFVVPLGGIVLGLMALWKLQRAWRAARHHFLLSFNLNGLQTGDAAAVRSVEMEFSEWRRDWTALRDGMTATADSFGLGAYHQAAQSIPSGLVTRLHQLRERLVGRSWRSRAVIPLRATGDAALAPWEAAMQLALRPPALPGKAWRISLGLGELAMGLVVVFAFLLVCAEGGKAAGAVAFGTMLLFCGAVLATRRKPGQELHFYRAVGPSVLRPYADEKWRQGAVRFASAASWELFVELGWRQLYGHARIKRGPALPYAELVPEPSEKPAFTTVFHAIGRAVGTDSGLRLQIGSAVSGAKPAGGSSSRVVLDPELLLQDDPAVVVLQGEPSEALFRTDSDRENAAMLRALAQRLMEAGARAVIVLPGMRAKLAGDCVATVARTLRGRRAPDLYRLLDIVAAVRQIIRESTPPKQPRGDQSAAELPLELPFDVVLFAPLSSAFHQAPAELHRLLSQPT